VYQALLLQAPQGDLKPKCFRYKGHHCGIEPQLIKLEFVTDIVEFKNKWVLDARKAVFMSDLILDAVIDRF
jgi:hypothetical protein